MLEPGEGLGPGGRGRWCGVIGEGGGEGLGEPEVRVLAVGVAGEGLEVDGENGGARAEALGEHLQERGLAHAALAGEEERGAAVVGEVVVDEADENRCGP